MFDAIWPPSGASAAVISRVVVVLPLVPVTRTTWRPAASRESRSGSRRRPIRPPMTEPSPLPARRETEAAASATVVASLARIGRRVRWWVFASIAADAIRLPAHCGARAAPAAVKAPLTSGPPTPVRPRRRRSEIGARTRGLRRRGRPAADDADVARDDRVRPGQLPDLVQRRQGGGAEAADRRVGVREQDPTAAGGGVADDHRGGRQPLQLRRLHQQLPRALEGASERLAVPGRP